MSCKSVLSVCSDLTERERGEVVTIGSSRKKSHVRDRPEGRRGTRDDDGLRGKNYTIKVGINERIVLSGAEKKR